MLIDFQFSQIAEKHGRKAALISCAVPQMVGWILIYFARNPIYLIISRLMHGFAGGGWCDATGLMTFIIKMMKSVLWSSLDSLKAREMWIRTSVPPAWWFTSNPPFISHATQWFGIKWLITSFFHNSFSSSNSSPYHMWPKFETSPTPAGIFIVIPIFITEISEDRWVMSGGKRSFNRFMRWNFLLILNFGFCSKFAHIFRPDTNRIRGRLGTLLIFTMSLGILLGYVLGDALAFTTVPLCLLLITNVFLAGVIIVHDSPMYLLRKSRFRVGWVLVGWSESWVACGIKFLSLSWQITLFHW